MPGRLFLIRDLRQEWPDASEDTPRRNMSPGEPLSVLTPTGWQRMRWGIIPVGRVNARGRPVMETIINARSETVFDKSAYDGVGRAVVPVDGWYEWTGETRRKTAWQITRKDGDLLWFAAITDTWTAPGGLEVPQVATVTCAPSADVCDIHHRMGVLLDRDQISQWIEGSEDDAKALMQPYPDGTLAVEKAVGVDWQAP